MHKLIISVALAGVLVPSLAFADKDFLDGKGATWDCKDDPVVNINTSAGTYTFTGACTTINLNGSSTTVKIEKVDELNINGAKNTVNVDVVGTINVNGSSNKVVWKKAKTGNAPAANVVGTGNKVGKK